MADKIRVGIVGATVTPGGSGWGANAHVPALRSLPDYELKAVCTSREETAQASAEKFGAELAFHDFNDMVAHPDIDLVAVSVRVPGTTTSSWPACSAGKPVFCEWPLGANLAEAEEMNDLAQERELRDDGRPSGTQRPVAACTRRELVAAGLHRRGAGGEPQRDHRRPDRARPRPHLAGRAQERRQHVHDRRRPRLSTPSASSWASSTRSRPVCDADQELAARRHGADSRSTRRT